MSPANPPESNAKPGDLLHELDRRQDDVLAQLDDLESQIDSVLADLGIAAPGGLDDPDESIA